MENLSNEEVSNDKEVEDLAAVEADVVPVSGEKNKEGSSKGKRRAKHKCPYSSCSANVVHLPRHMRQKHKWDEKDSIGVLGMFGLRGERKKTSNKRKRIFKEKMCPVLDCRAVVKRLHNHLTDFHNMKRKSSVYKKCLAEAVVHSGQAILSCESTPDTSSSEEVVVCRKKQGKVKKHKKHESIFKKVYISDEESESEEFVPPYPKIFQEEKIEVNISSNLSADEDSTDEDSTCEDSTGEFDELFDNGLESDMEVDDNGPDDIETPPSQQDFFKKFEEWLQGPDGGRKEERVAHQCSRQIEMVVEYIDKENRDLTNILHKRTLRDKWLTEFEKEKRPGTVKSYLASLNHFYIFLKCENPPQIDATEEMLSRLSAQVKLWNKSFQRLVKDRFWEKRLEDINNLKTPEQVKGFDVSSVARSAVKVIGDYQDLTSVAVPSQVEYTLVRDYLLTLLCINNGSRAGVLANMTLGEFRKAQEEDGSFVIKIRKHKTFTTHGHANIVLSPSLHQWMNIFVSKFRNSLENAPTQDTAEVFLTLNSQPMKPSAVGSQIGSCWAKVFGKEAGTGGATAFRKAAVSAVHQSDVGQRENLASLMDHKKSTADKFYLLQTKTTSAVQTSKYLSKLMHADGSSKADESGNAPLTSKIVDCGKKSKEIQDISTSKESECASKRRKWAWEENVAVKTAFATNIENKKITMEDVRVIASNHPILNHISPSKIRDKVRSLFSEDESAIPLNELPSETPQQRLTRIGIRNTEAVQTAERKSVDADVDGDVDDSSGSQYSPSVVVSTNVSKRSGSKLFTDEQNECFKNTFKSLVETNQSISQKYVRQKMEAEPILCPLLKKYTLVQLSDKVRTERRIHKRNSR